MKSLIVANWKCNPTSQKEARALFGAIKKGVKNTKKATIVICPPFVYLPVLIASAFARRKTSFGGLAFGLQDCFWKQKGAYTGEVSPSMLKDVGYQYVIVGHSDRKKLFGETDEQVNKKVKAALTVRLTPILCIGETKHERERGETETVVRRQLTGAFAGVTPGALKHVVVCYEPVWAISPHGACDVDEAQRMGLLVRKVIAQRYTPHTAKQLSVLYGGSVDHKNVAAYLEEAGFQGVLVGAASLKAAEFVKLVKAI